MVRQELLKQKGISVSQRTVERAVQPWREALRQSAQVSRVNPLGRFATTKLAGECPQVVAGDNLGAATRKLSYPAARSLISTGFS